MVRVYFRASAEEPRRSSSARRKDDGECAGGQSMTATDQLALPPAAPADATATVLWLKPVVAGVVLLLVLLSLLDLAIAYVTMSMPAAHFIAGPIALAVMAILWFIELEGFRWP